MKVSQNIYEEPIHINNRIGNEYGSGEVWVGRGKGGKNGEGCNSINKKKTRLKTKKFRDHKYKCVTEIRLMKISENTKGQGKYVD